MTANEDEEFVESNEKTHGNFSGKQLSQFPTFNKISGYSSLDFSNNNFVSLRTLPSLPTLEHLNLENTKIASFANAQKQQCLKTINIEHTPISYYPGVRLMCIVALGTWIESINGVPVTLEEFDQANEIVSRLRPLLISGWVITSTNPIRLVHSKTRKWGLLDELSVRIENVLLDCSSVTSFGISPEPSPRGDNFSVTSTYGVRQLDKNRQDSVVLMQSPNMHAIRKAYQLPKTAKKRVKQVKEKRKGLPPSNKENKDKKENDISEKESQKSNINNKQENLNQNNNFNEKTESETCEKSEDEEKNQNLISDDILNQQDEIDGDQNLQEENKVSEEKCPENIPIDQHIDKDKTEVPKLDQCSKPPQIPRPISKNPTPIPRPICRSTKPPPIPSKQPPAPNDERKPSFVLTRPRKLSLGRGGWSPFGGPKKAEPPHIDFEGINYNTDNEPVHNDSDSDGALYEPAKKNPALVARLEVNLKSDLMYALDAGSIVAPGDSEIMDRGRKTAVYQSPTSIGIIRSMTMPKFSDCSSFAPGEGEELKETPKQHKPLSTQMATPESIPSEPDNEKSVLNDTKSADMENKTKQDEPIKEETNIEKSEVQTKPEKTKIIFASTDNIPLLMKGEIINSGEMFKLAPPRRAAPPPILEVPDINVVLEQSRTLASDANDPIPRRRRRHGIHKTESMQIQPLPPLDAPPQTMLVDDEKKKRRRHRISEVDEGEASSKKRSRSVDQHDNKQQEQQHTRRRKHKHRDGTTEISTKDRSFQTDIKRENEHKDNKNDDERKEEVKKRRRHRTAEKTEMEEEKLNEIKDEKKKKRHHHHTDKDSVSPTNELSKDAETKARHKHHHDVKVDL